jgi:hypothetical protein
MMQQQRQLLKQFDANRDGWLNKEERKAAREFLQKERAANPGGRRFGPPGGPGNFGAATRPAGGGFAPTTRPTGENFGPPGGPGGGPGGFGGGRGPGGFGRQNMEPGKPGPHVSLADVKNFPAVPLYEPAVLRTIFLEFENEDWEAEMTDFHGTDVDVPAMLTVDGKKYPNVGVRFRGMSSYMMIPPGSKRSMNIALDLADGKQRLYGHKTLNLLNSHEDPTFLHTILYFQVARNYLPAPKANAVKLVVNGESWGVYVSAEQFSPEFLKEWFPNSKGTRWKVPGSPRGGGGLTYLGDNIEDYKRRYEIKSKDEPKAWKALVKLCRILNQTPPDKLEEALTPLLDIDKALWFLAMDDVFCNGDGYWVRDSDYAIFLDDKGKFHIIPHDANETFQVAGMGPGGPGGPGFRGGFGFGGRGPGGGGPGGPGEPGGQARPGGPGGPGGQGGPGGPGEPGGQARPGEPGGQARPGGPGGPGGFGPGGRPGLGGGPRGGGINLDPLIGLDDASKPLRSKLLTVPALKARYLEHVRTLATQWLDWNKLEPIVKQHRSLVEKEVEADTRKLDSFAEFKAILSGEKENMEPAGQRRSLSLKDFVEQRRNYLLNHPEVKKLSP